MLSFLNIIISWSFYLLFLFIPFAFAGDTSELFEFNKMWLTFGLAIITGGAWISKIIIERKFIYKKTPFDIPMLLFLASQIISTFISMDFHTSLWGYYSRFNGGLLSIISYVLFYFALVNNLNRQQVMNILKVSLVGGLLVALWGLPSHFGYDPTCLIFRGTLDVACWTDAFHPTIRMFSTMGQPDWLAAYLTLLLPLSMYFSYEKFQEKKIISSFYYALLSALFYLDFLYTGARGSFVALTVALLMFVGGFLLVNRSFLKQAKFFWTMCLGIIVISFFVGTPFTQLDPFTFNGIKQHFVKPLPIARTTQSAKTQPISFTGEFGGTDSGKIRLFVWHGAIDTWLHNPIFGTGVETFAYAYYQYRPIGHNLTSEWDYLYNKAHNEYLNYLATTGAIGLLTYLSIIGFFIFYSFKIILTKNKNFSSMQQLFVVGLVSSYFTILISNFFGFSVVIINVSFFLFPGILFALSPLWDNAQLQTFPKQEQTVTKTIPTIGFLQWTGISFVTIIACYWIISLFIFWQADKAYALGLNYDHANLPQNAYQTLHTAVQMRPGEPTFQDEVAVNDSTLASALFAQKDTVTATKLANEALQISTDLVTNHPNIILYWKSRVRILYTLAQLDPKYLPLALQSIQKAQSLAPTDAKISYNLGLLYAQTGQNDQAIQALSITTKLKPDYRDAYFALGLLLHQQAVDKNNKVVDHQKEQQAVTSMKFILTRLSPTDKATLDSLKSWGEE